MAASQFPRFTVITGCLTSENGHDDYDAVMQDVYVDMTGRYVLLGDVQRSIDPATGDVLVTVEVIDNGPVDAQAARF